MKKKQKKISKVKVIGGRKKALNPIKASLKLLGKFYNSEGKTVEEAITKLNPPVAKGMGILTMEKGNLKREKILNGRVINGVFGERSPTFKAIAMKNIISLFGEFND